MRMVLDRTQYRLEADVLVTWSVMSFGTIARRVLLAQGQRVHVQIAREVIEQALHREGRDWRAWCAISRGLRAIADYVVANDIDIGQVVQRESAHAARLHRRPRES